MKSISEKIMENLEKEGFKPLFTEKDKIKHDPDEIVVIYTPYMMVRKMPQKRITRRELEIEFEREAKRYHNWLIRFLKQKEKDEEYARKHPSKIRFGSEYAPPCSFN